MVRRTFRLRSLMALILVCGLILAAIDQLRRMEAPDWRRMREDGSILIVPFLQLVVLKLGFVLAMRSRRGPRDGEVPPSPPADDSLP